MERKNTWRQYLIIHNDNEVLNQNQSALKLAWSIDSSLDSRLALFGANPDIVVLILSPISKKMKAITSVTNIGGSLTNPGNQVAGLVGMTAKAVPILIANDSIGANLDIDVPLVEEIKLVRSEVDFDQLDFRSSESYIGASFALLPPFLSNVVIETKDHSPASLFIEFMIAMVAFERENPSQDESAWTESGSILQFRWAVSKNFIQPVVFEATDDEKATVWQILRSRRYILDDQDQASPSSFSPESMMTLSSSIQAQTGYMEKIQESVAQNSSDKKEKFDYLHDSTKLLILNSSSRNGEVTQIKPSLKCETFYNKKYVSQSKQCLIESLADKGCIVEIETSLVTTLVNGQFLRHREGTPSNFFIFLVPKMKPFSSSSFKSGMILRLKSLHSKWDDKDMKDIVKQGVTCHLSIEEMIYQINNFSHLCAFFFTKAFFAFRFLIVLNDRIKSHLTVLE